MAAQMLERHRDDQPVGTVARSRLLLNLIEDSYPTEALAAAYFDNLELMLAGMTPRPEPARLVLGLGSGRTGSTSLTELLATIDGSCSTHENPPLMSWPPERHEIDFHLRRFKRLAPYFTVIADVAHWWINALDEVFAHWPCAKAIGLCRELESCVTSFLTIKGFGQGSYNHWAPYGNGIWAAAQWDPTYPTYPLPEGAARDPDRAKAGLIRRYVSDYNEQLRALAAQAPDRIMLARTEDLNDPDLQVAIFHFIGARGRTAAADRNVRTTTDGRSLDFKF
jgi:hypothetical protein